jgi:hypothetical protein
VVSDLSIGAWQSQRVATDFCAQLGLEGPKFSFDEGFRPELQDGLSYAGLISRGIDAEALGETATLAAVEAATRIATAMQSAPARVFLVIAPRFGIDWEPEDLAFLRALSPRLRHTASELILVKADSAEPASGHDLLSLVPGIVDAELASSIQSLEPANTSRTVRLDGGYVLIVPECRRAPGSVRRLEFDRLAAALRHYDWLRAYAEYHGNNLFVEPDFLASYAWRCFQEGGSKLSIRLLDRAAMCSATPIERAVAACHTQGIRIASQQFDGISQMADPPVGIPDAMRSFLNQTKGYALVMSGEPQSALSYLEAAWRLIEHEPVSRESLYLQNISALALLRLGDAEGALSIEREIEARSAELPDKDWRLTYITQINIARLNQRLGDLVAARRAYRLAFATTLGSRSESEGVYTNLCEARLETECGQHELALLAWLRACLHWVSAQTPEALAARVIKSLLGQPISEPEEPPEELVEKISKSMLSSLAQSVSRAGLSAKLPAGTEIPPLFVRANHLTADEKPDWALGEPGWSVLGSQRRLGNMSMRIDTAAWQTLCSYVSKLLAVLSGRDEPLEAQTLVVDDRLGQELARNESELLETAVRLGVPCVVFGGKPLSLGTDLRDQLEGRARVRLGEAVARIDFGVSDTTIVFKRGRAPTTIPGDLGEVLNSLSDYGNLDELCASHTEIRPARLRELEALRIVYLALPEDSCTAAGIWQHSKVT